MSFWGVAVKNVVANPMARRVGLRGLTMFMRFLLPLYIASSMSMSELGLFGLVTGLVGMLPALTGLGLNFVLSRIIVQADEGKRTRLIYDRLIVSFLSPLFFCGILLPPTLLFGELPSAFIVAVTLLCVLESIAVDIDKCLLAINEPDWVIWLVFIRTGSWVFPLIVLGYFFSNLNQLSYLLVSWSVFTLFAIALAFRKLPRKLERSSFARDFPDRLTYTCFPVYLYDLSLVGLIYVERYIVAFALGLEAAGLYTFCWSLCNSIVSLVTTSILQPSMYGLVDSARDGVAWLVGFQKVVMQAAITCMGLGCVAFLGFIILHKFWTKLQIEHAIVFMALMLLGSCFRIISDAYGVAFYSRGHDRILLGTNLFALVVLCGLTFLGARGAGILGAACANVVVFLLLSTARMMIGRKSFAL